MPRTSEPRVYDLLIIIQPRPEEQTDISKSGAAMTHPTEQGKDTYITDEPEQAILSNIQQWNNRKMPVGLSTNKTYHPLKDHRKNENKKPS